MKTSNSHARDELSGSYKVVNLRHGSFNKVCMVHRLVAEAFIPNPNNLPTVNHIDGNKSNNAVENLEWASYSKNNQHALDKKLRKPRGIKIVQYDLQNNFISEYNSASEAARVNNLDRGSICHCLNNRRKDYAGYIWKYK